MPVEVFDAHRHIGALPPWPFYGGPAVSPDRQATSTVAEFVRQLDDQDVGRTLVLPNYGVPEASIAFRRNELALEAWSCSSASTPATGCVRSSGTGSPGACSVPR